MSTWRIEDDDGLDHRFKYTILNHQELISSPDNPTSVYIHSFLFIRYISGQIFVFFLDTYCQNAQNSSYVVSGVSAGLQLCW